MFTEGLAVLVIDLKYYAQKKWEDIKDELLLKDIDHRRFLLREDPVSQELRLKLIDSETLPERRQFRESLFLRRREIMGAPNPDLLLDEAYRLREKQRVNELFETVFDNLVIVP